MDLRDVGEQVLARLLGIERRQMVLTEPSILVAEDLTPSDTLHLDTKHVLGWPPASAVPPAHRDSGAHPGSAGDRRRRSDFDDRAGRRHGGHDGGSGCLYLDVSERPTDVASSSDHPAKAAREALRAVRHQPATTTDGHTVEIAANVANPEQATAALDAGAEGIGLMRTEFLFLERDHAPDEDEQYQVYREMTEVLAGRH